MTRADLIERIARRGQMSDARAELLVDTILGCLEQAFRQGERIELRGFGTFQVRQYKKYLGRNPMTGQTVAVQSKRVPHFKVSRELAARINRKHGKRMEAGGMVSLEDCVAL
jgi:integration host factor subunit beta